MRRFTGNNTSKPKAPPAVYCDASTSNSELMAGYLAAMRDPLYDEPTVGVFYVLPTMPARV